MADAPSQSPANALPAYPSSNSGQATQPQSGGSRGMTPVEATQGDTFPFACMILFKALR